MSRFDDHFANRAAPHLGAQLGLETGVVYYLRDAGGGRAGDDGFVSAPIAEAIAGVESREEIADERLGAGRRTVQLRELRVPMADLLALAATVSGPTGSTLAPPTLADEVELDGVRYAVHRIDRVSETYAQLTLRRKGLIEQARPGYRDGGRS